MADIRIIKNCRRCGTGSVQEITLPDCQCESSPVMADINAKNKILGLLNKYLKHYPDTVFNGSDTVDCIAGMSRRLLLQSLIEDFSKLDTQEGEG